jgi:hypothetical protein
LERFTRRLKRSDRTNHAKLDLPGE